MGCHGAEGQLSPCDLEEGCRLGEQPSLWGPHVEASLSGSQVPGCMAPASTPQPVFLLLRQTGFTTPRSQGYRLTLQLRFLPFL